MYAGAQLVPERERAKSIERRRRLAEKQQEEEKERKKAELLEKRAQATAQAMKEERERAITSGFTHFLTKPIDQKNLVDLLVRLIRPQNLRF